MADLRPVLILSARHRPIEISILFSALLSGVLGLTLVRTTQTNSILERLVPGYSWVFHTGLVLGSAVALISIFLKLPASLILERIGLATLTTFLLGYSISSFILLGVVGFSGASFMLFIGLGTLGRILQLNRDIRTLQGLGVGKNDG